MAVKFSAFTTRTGTLDASTRIVGYDDPAGTKTNVEFTLATLAANSGIYAADGTIGTTRKALVTDTIQFRNAGDTKDVFKLNTTGAFALGLDAANTSETNVCIGIEATTSSVYGVAIGRKVTMSAPASYATVIGNQSAATGSQSVIVGAYNSAGPYAVTIGTSAGAQFNNYSLNLGHQSQGSAANAVTINASGAAAVPSTQYAFGVYMSSNTTPDFEVVGGGESTFNTSVKITGQAYTEQHGTPSAGATIDWNNGNVQYIQLASGANTLSLSSPKSGATYILQVKQPSSGAAGTITYPTSVKYPGGTKSVLTTDNDAIDIITLIYNGTTTHYYASATLDLK